jgi:hypothetical protein
MRSSSLARVVIASLGVSVVITLGCSESPTEPSAAARLSLVSISPSDGPSVGATVARIGGTGFRPGATVTVDGHPADATVLDANTISVVMPAHAAGKVGVTVIRTDGLPSANVSGGYTYFGPLVITGLLPNIGSTGGGTQVVISGPGMCCTAVTVIVDGMVRPVESGWPVDEIYLSMPAHAAGPVEVTVTDKYGQAASGTFTYASPTTFDFNGDWQGAAEDYVAWDFRRLQLTIRDNIVVSVSCDSAPSVTLDPPPVVANGEFSFAGSDGVRITGRILSPSSASGTIDMAPCRSRPWSAVKK